VPCHLVCFFDSHLLPLRPCSQEDDDDEDDDEEDDDDDDEEDDDEEDDDNEDDDNEDDDNEDEVKDFLYPIFTFEFKNCSLYFI